MHKLYANKGPETYKFKFPPNMNVIDAISGSLRRKREDITREFIGMNPILTSNKGYINPIVFS